MGIHKVCARTALMVETGGSVREQIGLLVLLLLVLFTLQ